MRRALLAAGVGVAVLASVLILAPPTPVEGAGTLEAYLPGLNWPIAIAFSPDDRIFFAERFTGSVRVVDGGALLAAPFYTLANTATSGEQGLLGLALHPNFPTTPYVYAYHTFNDLANGTTYNRVVRLLAAGNTGTFDRVILDRIPAAVVHNGGIITFGTDGKLYAVDGDATNPAAVQDVGLLHGKTFRIEPDGTVPSDNPFVGIPGANEYIYTYGHRNMFGLTFHPTTGRPYVTENGPACNDEVNLLAAGSNYGWGPTATCSSPPPPPQNTNRDGLNPVPPISLYTPPIAPTNAAIYSGPMFPAYQGDLIMGDWNTRTLRHLDLAEPDYDTVTSESTILTAPAGILDVESGPDGAIWFTTRDTIYRYFDTAQPPVASFTANPARTSPGAAVTFDASASMDPDGTIVSYDWDFGDGAVGSGVVATHVYAAPGTYDVTLTVVDNETLSDSTTRQVFVNAPPRAAFSVSPPQGNIGTAITFDGSSSSDPDGAMLAFAWNFGDGGTSSEMIAVHAYLTRGAFTAMLTVTDADGASDTATRLVLIANRAPVITAQEPTGPTVGPSTSVNVTFSVTAEDPDGDPLSYTWRVNGAVQGSGTSFPFTSSEEGTYVVNVTVSDGSLADWREWTVVVGPTESAGTFPWLPAAALFVVVAVLAVVFFALWRRRRRPS